MTNQLYDFARYRLLTADLNWNAIDLMLLAWDGVPTFVPGDRKVIDIKTRAVNNERGESLPITAQSVSLEGVAQTNQVVIPGITIGTDVTHLTLCQRDAVDHDQSQLILFIDEAERMPFTPNGLDFVIQPDWFDQRGWFKP